MPAGLTEAYRSPFHRSNPGSQFYNLSSYTKSSSTDSLRNEYFQATVGDMPSDARSNARSKDVSLQQSILQNYYPDNIDFNSQYNLGGPSAINPQHLPQYNYPTMHPSRDHTQALPSYRKSSDTQSNDSDSSLIRNPNQDPNQGAGWAYKNPPTYLTCPPGPCKPDHIPPEPYKQLPVTEPYHSYDPEAFRRNTVETLASQDPNSDPDPRCEQLINQVLSNRKCRQLLKKLLLDDEDRLPPFKGSQQIEGFETSTTDFWSKDTIKSIVIYCLTGLLILCVLDLFLKLGQVIATKK